MSASDTNQILAARARACSNIALIKYWGNANDELRIPANGSISMNLAGLETITQVEFDPELQADVLILNGQLASDETSTRAFRHLDQLRSQAGIRYCARIESTNNFPTGAGIASSASSFAALSLAATSALSLSFSERELTAIARLGSGSAARSIPAGFVEWYQGTNHLSSFAESIAAPDYWDLVDCIAVVSKAHKAIGSSEGHKLAATSPLQAGRVNDAPRRLELCRAAIARRDFAALTAVVEHDTLTMHAVMMSSQPPLIYWTPPTLRVINAVQGWRAMGLPCCFTIDAGPNVHVLTEQQNAQELARELRKLDSLEAVYLAAVGAGASVLPVALYNRQ